MKYLTRSQVTREVKQVVAKTHNLRPSQVTLTFQSPWRECHFPTGHKAKYAFVTLSAPGFKESRKILEQDPYQKWCLR